MHDIWPSHVLVRYIYILRALAPDRVLPAAKSTLCPVLRSPGSVTARHSSSGRQPMFAAWYNFTRNGITELSQRTPPIFGRAAITLGIGPHSSSLLYDRDNGK